MYRATDILKGIYAENLKRGNRALSSVQKQKLLYYCQAWALVWTGKPLYGEEIQAWENGPVTPAARKFLKISDPIDLPADVNAIISSVYEEYGSVEGDVLSAQTHSEAPWQLAYSKGRNSVVSLEDMRRFFTEQSLRGQGPCKPYLMPESVETQKLLEVGARMSRSWARTLELLGQ